MRLLLVSFALAANLFFAIIFLSLSRLMWQTLANSSSHHTSSHAKDKMAALSKKTFAKGQPISPQPVAAEIESYASRGSFQQTLQEQEITPSPEFTTPTTDVPFPTTDTATPQATASADTTITPTPIASPAAYPASSFDEVYKQAGIKFGVPWQILFGIHKTETGARNGPIVSHSGSGAEGPMQFMPGTWKAYGIDGDGDGVADINNASDAIYSAANFLARHGSVMAGLHAYGGDTAGILELAQSRGYTP